MEVWAHRGRQFSQEFGNSMDNFRAAQHLGITGIETDICLTKDGQIIIYHPGSIKPELTEFTYSDIKRSVFKIATLDELLTFLQYTKLECCLDIKLDSRELVRRAVEKVVSRKLEKRIYFTAFQRSLKIPPFNIESSGNLLVYAKEVDPAVKTQLIVSWPFNMAKLVRKYNPDVLSVGWLQDPPVIKLASIAIFKTLDRIVNIQTQIRNIKSQGIKVWAGIFNDPEDMKYFSEMGVDGIMTDNSYLLSALIMRKKIL